VIEHYDVGCIKNPYLDRRIKTLKLTEQEKKDLVAFSNASYSYKTETSFEQVAVPASHT